MIADALRPPPLLDPTRARYKDWLHLNVFDHASGVAGLFNGSLHGAPEDDRSCVIGAALVHHPAQGWAGQAHVSAYAGAALGVSSVALPSMAIVVEPQGMVRVSATMPRDALSAQIVARPTSEPLNVEHPLPFGDGWIAWRAVPSLSVDGAITLGTHHVPLALASAYHDHNWGRWRWGDDIGWEWGVFASSEGGPVFVVSRTTDRAHTSRHPAQLTLITTDDRRLRRLYFGAQVELGTSGRFEQRLHRVPGALAALHENARRVHLPDRVAIAASDGWSRVELAFVPRAGAQLIASEPTHRGYSFINELVGSFTARWSEVGQEHEARGLGVFEWVC